MYYALFDTAIGTCGIAWTDAGLTRMQLPGADSLDTARRLARHPGYTRAEPTPAMARLIEALQAYMRGEETDFGWVDVDMSQADAQCRQVYEAARTIPWGRTVSYGELAALASMAGAARDVGQALARNPTAIVVPCHRIVGSGEKLGGFSAYGGPETKRRLLELEGAHPGAPEGQGALF